MNQNAAVIFKKLFTDHPELIPCENDLQAAFEMLKDCFIKGGKLLLCGNGGSAADCEHIAGELLKGFHKLRRPVHLPAGLCEADSAVMLPLLQGGLPAIPLVSHCGILTAVANDISSDMVYAQQVLALCKKEDVVLGLSTSGNSANVYYALALAKSMGAGTISMTGIGGGKCAAVAAVSIKAPEAETYKVQELHLPLYHALCAMIEAEFFQ